MKPRKKQYVQLNDKAYTEDKMRTIGAKVTQQEYRALRELATANDISVSQVIRKSLESYLAVNY